MMCNGSRTPVERHGALGSTNALAMERARAGDPGPLWIVAETQTAGRGRRGRPWSSPPGNLYASHFVRRVRDPDTVGMLPLAAVVALRDAIVSVTGLAARLTVKWPNDLLLDRRKLAGILLEQLAFPDGTAALVTGFGVNCAAAPAESAHPAVSLAEAGVAIAPDVLLTALDAAWETERTALEGSDGARGLRRRWCAHASGLGAPIEVRLDGVTLAGRFRDLADDCRLLLEREDGRIMTIAAGDVFLPTQTTES